MISKNQTYKRLHNQHIINNDQIDYSN